MSIGNLKDEGNKGNNFPWQLKMLQGVSAAYAGITNIVASIQSIITDGITTNTNPASEDASFRNRVSQLNTLGDLKSINKYRTDLWLQNSLGTGTVAWNSNNTFSLGVTASNDRAIIQSKVSYPYFAGKSQLVEVTFSQFQAQTDVIKRVGYYDSFSGKIDGFWLESEGLGTGAKITLNFANALDSTAYQWTTDEWINPIFRNYNWEQFTVVLFDFLWLGGLRLRMFISGPEGFVLAHEINYAGALLEQGTFTAYPSHPVTYDIEALTTLAAPATFRPICSQVASEGAIDNSGIIRSCSTRTTAQTLSSNASFYPVLAIRKAYANSPVKLLSFELSVATNNDRLYWEIQINPALSAALTFTDIDAQSVTQFATGNGTIVVNTSGRVIASGYLSTGQSVRSVNFEDNFLALIGGTSPNIAFTSDVYVLAVRPITTPINVLASMQVKEL